MIDFDPTLLALDDLVRAVRRELASRPPSDWLLCFVPVVLFFEIPRYYFPLVGLLVARRLGYPRVDHDARRCFLERAPLVSIVVVGRNEGQSIRKAIESILAQDYPNFELIVVDDASDDDMPVIARRYAREGKIRFVRNDSGRGRGGRPSGTNLGIRIARGEIIASLDADTTFDRSMLRNLIAPFADPGVGVVAGNLLPWNVDENVLTRIQALEYAVGIDINKQWTHLFGSTLQASGAIGAFRRDAVLARGGWDQELAEDTDISLRMVQAGYKVAFAPEALARTEVPSTARALAKQRARWDRGGLRAYYKKHGRMMRPSVSGVAYAFELTAEFLFFVVGTVLFPLQLVWLAFTSPLVLLPLLVASVALYSVLALFALAVIPRLSGRLRRPRTLIGAALCMGAYKHWLGWVRFRAFVEELLLIRTEDPFLPTTAWANARRF